MKTEYETEIEKYSSRNPLVRAVIDSFLKDLHKSIRATKARHIIDIGCGIGITINKLKKIDRSINIDGFDTLQNSLNLAKKKNPESRFYKGDIYNIQLKSSYDLVMCNSVLEHLKEPSKAIKELKRISKDFVIISVPNEPLFSIVNLMRLKYIRTLGNYPGHIQRWNRYSLRRLLKRHFNKVNIKTSTFWLIALCRK